MPCNLQITGVCLPREQHALLREAARGRQRANGGRVSVSRIISEMIDAHRGDLAKDAEKNLPGSAMRCK
jgi:hypothetical protein